MLSNASISHQVVVQGAVKTERTDLEDPKSAKKPKQLVNRKGTE